MARKVKPRKIFSFDKFRGLDKENKLLKVAKYRASDGHNFIIDSEALKTRPAFKFKKEPGFTLEDGDFIVDWYDYKGITIYVTKKHIYIVDGSLALNEETSHSKFETTNFDVFDFEGKTPIFKEEKDALFIFGLDKIFVVAFIYEEFTTTIEKYVLYELRKKPDNPYTLADTYLYESFRDLPTPYEPTLFIGDKPFEDVNLLSNVSKYKLFASKEDFDDGGRVNYKLPTHYDESKNVSYEHEVTIYKDKFSDIGIIPVFLGVPNEDFQGSAPVESIHNNTGAISIQDVFHPKKDFEYFGTSTTVESTISEIIGLSKNDFFSYIIKDKTETVFEYLMNYINVNEGTLLVNMAVHFSLPVKKTKIFRDSATNYVKETKVIQENIDVYVLLKKFEDVDMVVENQSVVSGSKVTEYTLADPYPSYPSFTLQDHNFEMDAPIQRINFDEEYFKSLAVTYLDGQSSGIANGETMSVKGQLYETRYETSNPTSTPESHTGWDKASDEKQSLPTYNEFPLYPTFSNPNGYQVIEPQVLFGDPNDEIPLHTQASVGSNLGASVITNKVASLIQDAIPFMSEQSGSGFAKIRVMTYSTDSQSYWIDSVIVEFTFSKGDTIEYEIRQSFVFIGTANKNEIPVDNELFQLSLNTQDNVFELKVKDYFYDYNNEPSIEVKITFSVNPDYDRIANNKFGITFGSEERLFLAGHEDYPNIDRYNVSNDLLGDNIKNQSYELSYFPSRNYRVIGGRGAINGYVVATDTQLYVTKEDYPNDQKLFIRSRILDENGVVGYKEFKTNINKTPLNHRCLVRFFNDILMLTRDGLYAIEISSNVLTNEQLIKMRSGFINKDLMNEISNFDERKVFIVENNYYMYIFVNDKVYVADSRYVFKNPNGEIDNLSYEIVKWQSRFGYKYGKFINNELLLLEENGLRFYEIKEDNVDDLITYHEDSLSHFSIGNNNSGFMGTQEIDAMLEDSKGVTISFDNVYKLIGLDGTQYTLDDPSKEITTSDFVAFRNVKDGDTLFFKDTSDVLYPFTVSNYEASGFTKFNYDIVTPSNIVGIYKDVSNTPLYVSMMFEWDVLDDGNYVELFRLSPYEQEEVDRIKKDVAETKEDYEARVMALFQDNEDYHCSAGMISCTINQQELIEMIWYSAITEFGNRLMEKTTFKALLFASAQAKENSIILGYKTMRSIKVTEEVKTVGVANPMSFDDMNFNIFALSTFSEMGMKVPMKENNFLYIQMMVKALGNIELNGIDIIYKDNRMIKTIS